MPNPPINCPKLVSYPPIVLTKEMETVNTAVDKDYPFYSSSNAPYFHGDIVRHGNFIFMSTRDNNETPIAGIEDPYFKSWGAVALDGGNKLIENSTMKKGTGISVFDGTRPPRWVEPDSATSYGQFAVDDHVRYLIPRSQSTTFNVPIDHLNRYIVVAAPDVQAPDMQISLGEAGIFHVIGNRGVEHANGGNASVTITLRPNEFMVYIFYTYLDDVQPEDENDPPNTSAAIYYQVGKLGDDLSQDTSNPLSLVYGCLDYWYKLRAGYPYSNSLPAHEILTLEQSSNNAWEYMGMDIRRSVLDDTSAGGYRGAFRYDYSTGILYSLQRDTKGGGGRSYVRDSGDYELDLNLTDWKIIGTINSFNIYNSMPSVQTTAEGELTLEWDVEDPFEALTLVALTAHEVEVTITDDAGNESYHGTFNLEDGVESYTEWLFEITGQTTILKLRELDPSPTSKLTIRLSAEDPNGTELVGIGAVYPSNPRPLGDMAYAPTISATNTTRVLPLSELRGVQATVRGTLVEKVNYKTKTPAEELDYIVKGLRLISKLSVEEGYPTYFEGQFPYDALQFLGYMPIYSQTLDSRIQTSASINITGAL